MRHIRLVLLRHSWPHHRSTFLLIDFTTQIFNWPDVAVRHMTRSKLDRFSPTQLFEFFSTWNLRFLSSQVEKLLTCNKIDSKLCGQMPLLIQSRLFFSLRLSLCKYPKCAQTETYISLSFIRSICQWQLWNLNSQEKMTCYPERLALLPASIFERCLLFCGVKNQDHVWSTVTGNQLVHLVPTHMNSIKLSALCNFKLKLNDLIFKFYCLMEISGCHDEFVQKIPSPIFK